MLIWIVLALLLLALALPYGITLWLNFRMISRLEKACQQAGFRVRRLYSALIFVRNRSSRYDLLLEGSDQIYAIKLWSAVYKGNSLIITENGTVYEQKLALLPMDLKRENRDIRAKGIRRTVPRTHLTLAKNEKRAVTGILLQYPAYRQVLAEREGRLIPLGSGSAVYDKLLYSPSALEELLYRGASARKNPSEEWEVQHEDPVEKARFL